MWRRNPKMQGSRWTAPDYDSHPAGTIKHNSHDTNELTIT